MLTAALYAATNCHILVTTLRYAVIESVNRTAKGVAEGQEPARWLYTFDEQDGKTTVTLTVDYTLPGKWLGQMVDRLLVERKNRQQCVESLAALKQQVEAAVAASA